MPVLKEKIMDTLGHILMMPELITYTNAYTPVRSVTLSNQNYICSTCGLEVPKNRKHNEIGDEVWSGGTNGENARHIWLRGCDAARKRHGKNGKLEEPDVVY